MNSATKIAERIIHTSQETDRCWIKISNQSVPLSKGSISYNECEPIFIKVSYEDGIWYNISVDYPEDIRSLSMKIVVDVHASVEIDHETLKRIIAKLDEITELINNSPIYRP